MMITKEIKVFEKLIKYKDYISNNENMLYNTNVDKISINIGLYFLQLAMGVDVYEELLEG